MPARREETHWHSIKRSATPCDRTVRVTAHAIPELVRAAVNFHEALLVRRVVVVETNDGEITGVNSRRIQEIISVQSQAVLHPVRRHAVSFHRATGLKEEDVSC